MHTCTGNYSRQWVVKPNTLSSTGENNYILIKREDLAKEKKTSINSCKYMVNYKNKPLIMVIKPYHSV